MSDNRKKINDEDIINVLRFRSEPVWTSTTLSEQLPITRQTANKRLEAIERDYPSVKSMEVGQAVAYYYDQNPPAKDDVLVHCVRKLEEIEDELTHVQGMQSFRERISKVRMKLADYGLEREFNRE